MDALIIDNYDSFTFNLVQMVEEAGIRSLDVWKHDEVTLTKVQNFEKIIFSPGPDIPQKIPVMDAILQKFGPEKDILGVCLGHQAIATFYGGNLYQLPRVVHGVQKTIENYDSDHLLFRNLPKKFEVGVYHSWAVEEKSLPAQLLVTAKSQDGIIMGLQHRTFRVTGIQFHPESYLTPYGFQIIKNWLGGID